MQRNTKYPTSREINKGEEHCGGSSRNNAYTSKDERNTKWMRKGVFTIRSTSRRKEKGGSKKSRRDADNRQFL